MTDHANRLVKHVTESGIITTFRYDPTGRRVENVLDKSPVGGDPAVTRYFFDGWRVVEETDDSGAGSTRATYVYGLYIDEPLVMRRGTSEYTFHRDDLYSVVAATDASGAVVERIDYGDYGEATFLEADGSARPAASTSKSLSPYLFTGREWEPELLRFRRTWSSLTSA